ncbi:pentapeptide repeat-containing protein [Actinorugispora endophytica]|uniref:Pentapeptide repeat protein n=1 Tax=Actinorugispora endophytica TaxID=1605990 RepID=A0A4R6UU88_9ACTN|nr:pentapeptide repeat-containing protein [Actinorugispora endophytica]TDQ50751.1 pentapeptide repeat protein [Actinorugispora endophytica]
MTDIPPPAAPLPPRSRARVLLAPVGRAAGLARMRRAPLRSGAVGAGLVLAVVAGAPLASRVWAGVWSLPHAGRLALVAFGLAVVAAAALWGTPRRLRERVGRARLGSVIVAAWAVVIAVVALIVVGAWWVMGAPRPLFPDRLPPKALDAIATRAFAVVAGLGAAALLVISYRRQRTTEEEVELAKADDARARLAAAREVTRLFTERFTSAYTELGSEHAAVRLGAVHALAHLADDAPTRDLRQTCVDVLCAYLRMPYEPEPGPLPGDATEEQVKAHRAETLAFASLREVRHTILRAIGNRLREDTPWRGCDYDFTGVVFDGGDLHEARFSDGRATFRDAKFSGGAVDFTGAVFSGGAVDFTGAEFAGGWVAFNYAEFAGGTVDFTNARFTNGMVSFADTEFSGGRADFNHAEFAGGAVDFTRAKFTGGIVDFIRAEFTGGPVDFTGAAFSDGWVDFTGAAFSGGRVDFAGDPAATPGARRPASGACPDRLAEAAAAGTPGVVLLPPEWESAGAAPARG